MKSISTIVIIFLVSLFFIFQGPLCAQNIRDSLNDSDTTTSDTSKSEQVDSLEAGAKEAGKDGSDTGKRGFSTQALKDLIKLAGRIGYVLGIVLTLGMLFIFQQWFVLIREGQDANKIPVNQIKTMSYEDIAKMFTQVRDEEAFSLEQEKEEMKKLPLLKKLFRRKKASAFQLLHKLFVIFDKQKSTSSFNEETANFVQYLKDMFNPFMTRLSFLSDTAGALGLLGTVWGMFMVFYKGTPNPDDILKGMGVALATTILGLVISIVLNSFTTVVSNIFDRHLDIINKMSSVFQERLMREEQIQPAVSPQVVIDSSAVADLQKSKVTPKTPEKVEDDATKEVEKPISKKEIFGPPSKIHVVSGDNQTAEVNSKLANPIVVEVLDDNGNPLENQAVVFSSEDGAGVFSNNNNVQKVLTNDEGRAQTELTMGKTTGEKTIRVALDNNGTSVTLLAVAKPTPASKFVEIDGNYQTGEMGKRLDKPFTVAVKDNFDNPIPRHEVSFNLVKGTGKFQDSQNAHLTTFTNENGLVQVYFIAGNTRGGREIMAEAKKVEPTKINFEVFAL